MYKILPILLFAYGMCGFKVSSFQPDTLSECVDNTAGLVFILSSHSKIKLDAPITCEKAKEELGCAFEIGDYSCDDCGFIIPNAPISEYCPKTCGLCEKEIVSYEELSKSIKALHLDILNEIDAKIQTSDEFQKKIKIETDRFIQTLYEWMWKMDKKVAYVNEIS